MLTEKSFSVGEMDDAFAHAFISHSKVFPSIKDHLKELDEPSASHLEALIAGLTFKMKSGKMSGKELRIAIVDINETLDGITASLNPDKAMKAQIIVFLLRDAVQSYQLSNFGAINLEYENAVGLLQVANSQYLQIENSIEEKRKGELDSFFSDLKLSIDKKANIDVEDL